MTDDLSDERIIRAIGHPLRRKLLTILDEETASPKELAQRLEETLSVVSYHVGVLRDLGLIEVAGQHRRRGAIETHYRSGARPALDEGSWASLSPTVRRSRWKSELRQLTSSLDAASRRNALELDATRVAQQSFEFDAEGCAAAHACLRAFWDGLEQISSQSRQRSTSSTCLTVATLLFPTEPPAPPAVESPGRATQPQPRRST